MPPGSREVPRGAPRVARAVLPLFCLILAAVASPVRAQLPHLDPIPWHTPADSTSRLAMVVDLQRTTDDHTGWNSNRILLTAILPAGDRGTFFLRIPHVTFDTGGLSLRGRWPWVLGEAAEGDWPGEDRPSSFGQMEVGVTGPLRLPLVGLSDYAIALGVPMGSDRVYPFSSTSIPLRLAYRKPVDLGGRRRLDLKGVYLKHMGSGKDFLDDSAFPGGWLLGASFDWYRGEGGRFGVAYDFQDREGRLSQIVAARLWFPWAQRSAIGLEVARELAGTLDRPAAWTFTVTWRLNSARYRSGHEVPPAVMPGTLPDAPPKP
jgi:hypothetical protein